MLVRLLLSAAVLLSCATIAHAAEPGHELDVASPPPGFRLFRGSEGLLIEHDWYTLKTWLFLLFVLFWNGICLWAFREHLFPQQKRGKHRRQRYAARSWGLYLFMGFFGFFGLVLFPYFMLAGFVNCTTIHVTSQEITVTHGPIPWSGSVVSVVDSDQFFVDSVPSRRSTSYYVNVRRKDGSIQGLNCRLSSRADCCWVARVLERQLAIADAPVQGELKCP